jgi:ammonia channel protein AmtB
MDGRGRIVFGVAMIGLRVKEQEEKTGLSLAIHNERAYNLMEF